MTESELCGSSFDWEGSSPSVFLRPMNPALSAQHYFPEDSPVLLDEKENWRRSGLYMTPASPLFGSISYMSQESSCCSVLNNAVIMEEDDNETIPTDERPSLVPVGAEDVSPIVEKSFNVSDLPVANVSSTTNSSFPAVINPSAEDRSNSSLQDLLYNNPQPVDVAFIGNSPGPQWSPGIKGVSTTLKSPTHQLIRLDNFLDSSPTLSPTEKKIGNGADSSLSLSAILPPGHSANMQTEIIGAKPLDFSDLIEEPQEIDPEPVTTTHRQLGSNARAFSQLPIEPSPVRHFTHKRSSPPIVAHVISEPAFTRRPSPYSLEETLPGTKSLLNSLYKPRQPLTARRTVLSSEERAVKEAEEGKRRLLSQIRSNRRNFETLRSGIRSPGERSSFLDRSSSRPISSFIASRPIIPTERSTYIDRSINASRIRSCERSVSIDAHRSSSRLDVTSRLDRSIRVGPVKVELTSQFIGRTYNRASGLGQTSTVGGSISAIRGRPQSVNTRPAWR